MALATRELELILIAKDRSSATMARVAGALVILGAAVTALGVKGIREFGEMTREAAEFRQMVALAVTQADGLSATIENVGAIVNRVGTDLPVPFEELGDALFDIFSTFTSDQLSSLEQAEQLLRAFGESAIAGQAPIRDVGRSVIAWINALDQPATIENVTRILDIQFELVRKGAGTYSEFAGQIGKAIPAFVAAGQTTETFAGSLAFLTKNGLTAAMASTSAARAVELMFTPKAIKGLREVGIEVENGAGEFRQMNDILTDLAPIFNDLSASQKKIKFKEIFGTGRIQARRFFDLALPNIDEFNSLTETMNLSSGEAQKAFELMFGQPLSQMDLFKNRLQSIRREFGDVFLKTLEDKVFPVLERLWQWWQDLSPATKELIIKISTLTAVVLTIAGAVLMAVGFFLLFKTILSAVAGKAGGAVLGLGKILIALGPLGLVLVALGIAAFIIFKNWDKVWPFLVKVWEKVTQAAKDFMEANKEFFAAVLEKAQEIWGKLLELGSAIWNRLAEIWETTWNAMLTFWAVWGDTIMATIATVWGIIQEIIMTAMSAIGAAIDFFTAIFNGDWAAAWDAFVEYFGFVWDIILGLGEVFLEILGTLMSIAWDAIKNVAEKAWDKIKEILAAAWNKIKEVASNLWQGILDFFKGIWESITGTAKDTISGTGGLLEFFQELPGKILEAVTGLLIMMIEWGGKVIGSILEGGIPVFVNVLLWFLDLPGKILEVIPQVLGLLWDVGADILRGLWNGVKWLWSNVVVPWFKGIPRFVTETIPNMIRTLFDIGKTLLKGIWNGIKWVWNNLILIWIKDLGNKVKKGIGDLIDVLFQAGKDVIQGLWNGMKDVWKGVSSWVSDKAGWIGRKFKSVLGMNSPSRVMFNIGRDVMKGFETGVRSGFGTAQRRLERLLRAQEAADAARRALIDPRLLDFRGGQQTITNTTNAGQTFNFGDIISDADPEEIAAQIGWMVRII